MQPYSSPNSLLSSPVRRRAVHHAQAYCAKRKIHCSPVAGLVLHGYGLYVVTFFLHTPLNAENNFVQFNLCYVSHACLHPAFIAVLSLHWCCAAVVFDNQVCHTVPLCLSLTTMVVAQCYWIHCLFFMSESFMYEVSIVVCCSHAWSCRIKLHSVATLSVCWQACMLRNITRLMLTVTVVVQCHSVCYVVCICTWSACCSLCSHNWACWNILHW